MTRPSSVTVPHCETPSGTVERQLEELEDRGDAAELVAYVEGLFIVCEALEDL